MSVARSWWSSVSWYPVPAVVTDSRILRLCGFETIVVMQHQCGIMSMLPAGCARSTIRVWQAGAAAPAGLNSSFVPAGSSLLKSSDVEISQHDGDFIHAMADGVGCFQ